jgi:hypothetical protein
MQMTLSQERSVDKSAVQIMPQLNAESLLLSIVNLRVICHLALAIVSCRIVRRSAQPVAEVAVAITAFCWVWRKLSTVKSYSAHVSCPSLFLSWLL